MRASVTRVRRERIPLHASADRKSTRLNSSHLVISYAVFCLKKEKNSHGRAPERNSEAVSASDPSCYYRNESLCSAGIWEAGPRGRAGGGSFFFLRFRRPPSPALFPYKTLSR